MKTLLVILALLVTIPTTAQDRKELRQQRRDAKVSFVREQQRVHRRNFPNKPDGKKIHWLALGALAICITLTQHIKQQ